MISTTLVTTTLLRLEDSSPPIPCFTHPLLHSSRHRKAKSIRVWTIDSIAGNMISRHCTWRVDAHDTSSDWTLEIVSEKDEEMRVTGNMSGVSPSSPSDSTHAAKQIIQTYFVHSHILGSGPRKSEYFSKLFHHAAGANYEESKSGTSRVKLPNIAAAAVPDLLDYLYTSETGQNIADLGNSGEISKLVALHYLGDYFDIECLRIESLKQINFAINYQNALKIYSLSTLLLDEGVINLVAFYINDWLSSERNNDLY